MKNYYGDVTIIIKQRIRIDLDSNRKPTKAALKKMLNEQGYNDILDEETIECLEVLDIELESQEEIK